MWFNLEFNGTTYVDQRRGIYVDFVNLKIYLRNL
jgi:hypothetical protein